MGRGNDGKITTSSVVRGGKSDFNWDKINPEEKDHYLGVSSNQTTTRNGKDLLWYTKKTDKKLDKKNKKKVKKLEDKLMNAELGISSRAELDKDDVVKNKKPKNKK